MCKFSHCNMLSSLAENKSLTAISLCPLQCVRFQSFISNKSIQIHLYILYVLNIYIENAIHYEGRNYRLFTVLLYQQPLNQPIYFREECICICLYTNYCMICVCSYTNFYFMIHILNSLSNTKNCLHFKLIFYTQRKST